MDTLPDSPTSAATNAVKGEVLDLSRVTLTELRVLDGSQMDHALASVIVQTDRIPVSEDGGGGGGERLD